MRILLLKLLRYIATATLEKFLNSKEKSLGKLIQAEEKIQRTACKREAQLDKEYASMKSAIHHIAERKLNKAADKRQQIEQL